MRNCGLNNLDNLFSDSFFLFNCKSQIYSFEYFQDIKKGNDKSMFEFFNYNLKTYKHELCVL